MKPDWDKLAKEFQGSPSVLIADVDCTVEKALCSKFGVRGYPTIKYFTGATAADGDKYEGARDYASLQKFASESLGPSCSNDNADLCNEEQLAILAEGNAMTAEERAAFIAAEDKKASDAEAHFTESVAALQAQYQTLVSEKEAAVASVSPKVGLFRTIKASSAGHDEL